jgi:hypothetical protein
LLDRSCSVIILLCPLILIISMSKCFFYRSIYSIFNARGSIPLSFISGGISRVSTFEGIKVVCVCEE